MSSKQNSLAKNAVLNVIKTVLGILFPVITYPYVSRILGVNNMGLFNFSTSFVSYFILIAGLGIATYGIREGSAFRDDTDRFKQFINEIFTINFLATLVSYILLVIIVFVLSPLEKYKTLILILSIEIFFTTIGVSWVCNIFEDFYYIAVRTVVFQVVSLILIFIMIKSENDLIKYLFVVLLANSGANILNFFYIQKKYCKFRVTLHGNFRRHIKPILTIFSTNIAMVIYVSYDSTMLGLMLDESYVGLYGTAVKVYTIIKNVLVSILLVLIPRFSILFSNNKDSKEVESMFSSVFKLLSFIMLPMCTGLFMTSQDMINVVFGREYDKSSLPLSLLCIAISFSLYAYLFVQCVLIPLKLERIVLIATSIGAVVNLFLNLFLIPYLGIIATSITTIIAEFITFLVVIIYSKKLIKMQNIRTSFLKSMLGCVLIVIVCLSFKLVEDVLIRFIMSVIISSIVYMLSMLLLRNEAMLFFVDRFLHIIKKRIN